MNEQWNAFLLSGKIEDYLRYRTALKKQVPQENQGA